MTLSASRQRHTDHKPQGGHSHKMAGVGRKLHTSEASGGLVFQLILVLLMGTCVHAGCNFTIRYGEFKDKDSVGQPSKVLELDCFCPKGAGWATLENFEIEKETTQYGIVRLFPDENERLKGRVTVVADTTKTTSDQDKRVMLRLRDVQEQDDGKYICTITGRKDPNQGMETVPLVETFGLSDVLPPTTTTSTTTTTTTTTPRRTSPSPTPPSNIDDTEVAATTVNQDDTFSRTNLYIVLAVSCVLLVVIVLSIICYVRVRRRRHHEKMDRNEKLDLDDGNNHAANQNLIYRPPALGNVRRDYDGDICEQGDFGTSTTSPLRNMVGQNIPHGPTQPRPRQHAHAEIHGRGRDDRGGREKTEPEWIPLLPAQNFPENRRRAGGRSASEDEDEGERRKQRLLLDTPRRTHQRDPAFQFGRSHDDFDFMPPAGATHPRSRRFSFPRRRSDADSFSDDDFAASRSQRYRDAEYGHPPRSLSQNSLPRRPANYHPYPSQAPPLDRHFFPDRPTTNPRDFETDQFFAPPTGQRQQAYDEVYGGRPPPLAFRDRRHVEGSVPLTVRVREDNNVVYHNYPYSETDEGGSSMGGDVLYQTYDANYVAGGGALPQAAVRGLVELSPRPSPVTPILNMTSGDEMARGEPQHGNVSDSGIINQQRNRRYPSHSLPSRRQRYHSTSSSPTRHYNTSSIPRNRSADRMARPGRSAQLRQNRSQPQLYYLSDGETGRYFTFSTAPPQPLQQYATEPHSQRSLSHSAGDILEDSATSPRQNLQRERENAGEMTSAVSANQDLGQPPSPAESEVQRQMNLLSRESTSPSRGPTTPLNVPLRSQNMPSREQTTTQHGGDTSAGERGQCGRSEGQSQQGTRRVKTTPRSSRLPPSDLTSATTGSDSSPDMNPRRRGHRRSSLTSSDNDNYAASVRGRGEHGTPERAEINLRDIKPDNETRRKRPFSFKTSNVRTPVACAADMAADSQGGAISSPRPRGSGLQREPSGSSRSRGGSSRSGEGARSGTTRWAEQFGLEILPTPDNSVSGQYSHYTANNHSTNVKTPHPRVE